jgi:HEAT repeat protein
MEEKLDAEYVEMMVLLHGIKKDSGLGELDRSPAPEIPMPSQPKPPTQPPGPAPETAPAKPPEASVDPAEKARSQLAAIEAFEKEHQGDLPALQHFYEKFLAENADPSLPQYATAAARLGQITDRMRTLFQNVAKRDLDSVVGGDSKAGKTVLARLTQDFSAKDADVRRRSAKLLADTRCAFATYLLAKGLDDKDPELAKTCRDGLVAIGGARTGENLVKLYRDAEKDDQMRALGVLKDVAAKSPVDAGIMAPWLGRFALAPDDETAQAAILALQQMGPAGGPGLICALDTKKTGKRIDIIRAIAHAKYYKGAAKIGTYLVTGDGAVIEGTRDAAISALKEMGVSTVPYLIPLLQTNARQYTAYVLREITGERLGFNDANEWKKWWEENKPKD